MITPPRPIVDRRKPDRRWIALRRIGNDLSFSHDFSPVGIDQAIGSIGDALGMALQGRGDPQYSLLIVDGREGFLGRGTVDFRDVDLVHHAPVPKVCIVSNESR